MNTVLRLLVVMTLAVGSGFSGPTGPGGVPVAGDGGSDAGLSAEYPPRPLVECGETIEPPAPTCADLACDDPLFKQHPAKGNWITARCSELTIPFTVYDNEFMAIFGSADLGALRSVTAGSGFRPVATEAGRGLALLFVAFQRDTNTGPYYETGLMFSVDEEPRTVDTENPYTYVAEMFRPDNEMWWVKLLLSEHFPIEYGREILGYDKNPHPQNMAVTTVADSSSVRLAFRFEDPGFHPILSGRVTLSRDPAGQAEAVNLLAAAPGGTEFLGKVLFDGGVLRVNTVSPDVLGRTDELIKSHALLRPTSLDLGLWDEGSKLSVNPGSDYGAALGRIDFQPVVSAYLPFRLVLDNGWAP